MQLEKTTSIIDSKNQLIADQMRVIKKKDQIMQTLMTMVPAFARKEGIRKKSLHTHILFFSQAYVPYFMYVQLLNQKLRNRYYLLMIGFFVILALHSVA